MNTGMVMLLMDLAGPWHMLTSHNLVVMCTWMTQSTGVLIHTKAPICCRPWSMNLGTALACPILMLGMQSWPPSTEDGILFFSSVQMIGEPFNHFMGRK